MFLWKFFGGYAKIEVICRRPERFANEVLNSGISLHNLSKIDRCTMQGVLRFEALDELSEIAEAYGAKLRVVKTGGTSVIVHSLFSRCALMLSLAASIAAMLFLSSRILSIRIDGADAVLASEIAALLKDNGIVRMAPIACVDKAELARSIAALDPRIGYVRIETNGAVLDVSLFDKPPLADAHAMPPSSVYADKDCIIVSISALDGRELVRAGEAVKKDQMLISGDVTPEQGANSVLVHSCGEIIGEVAYRFKVDVPSAELGPVPSGNSMQALAIELFGIKLEANIDYADYSAEYSQRSPLNAVFLPVFVLNGVARELTLGNRESAKAEMLEEAERGAQAAISAAVPHDAVIISKSTELAWNEDGSLELIVYIHTYEKIGYTRYL